MEQYSLDTPSDASLLLIMPRGSVPICEARIENIVVSSAFQKCIERRPFHSCTLCMYNVYVFKIFFILLYKKYIAWIVKQRMTSVRKSVLSHFYEGHFLACKQFWTREHRRLSTMLSWLAVLMIVPDSSLQLPILSNLLWHTWKENHFTLFHSDWSE